MMPPINNLDVIRETLTFTHGPLYDACAPGALQAYIWSLPGKRTRYARSLPELIAHAIDLAEQNPSGVYVSQAAFDGAIAYRVTERPKADSSFAVGHFWSDFDIDGPAHKKGNLPPTLDALLNWLKTRWPWYSRLDASGHGVYLHMGLEKPAIFADDAERQRYATLGVRLNAYWIEAARRDFGWAVDSTADHARILRVIGTVNRKLPEAPVATYVIDQRAERFSYPQIVAMLAESVASLSGAPVRSVIDLGASSGAPPAPVRALALPDSDPDDKRQAARALAERLTIDGRTVTAEQLEQLEQMDPEFTRIWSKQGKPPEKDDSHSGWDLALAGALMRAGLNEQFVCDVLIAYRSKHGQEVKPPIYYALTITEAKKGPKRAIARVVDYNAQAIMIDDIETKRAGYLKLLSQHFQARIEGFRKSGKTKSTYFVKVEGYEYEPIGTIRELDTCVALVDVMRDITGLPIPRVKAKEWMPLLEAILAVAVEIDLGEEATLSGEVRGWINGHVGLGLQALDENTAQMKIPFYKGGRVYIFADKLLQYVINTYRKRMSKAELVSRLHQAGCEPVRYDFHANGLHLCRSVWRLPLWLDMDYTPGDPSDDVDDTGPIPDDTSSVVDTFIDDALGQ